MSASVVTSLLPDYEVGPTIGVGGYAEVRVAQHRETEARVRPRLTCTIDSNHMCAR